MKPGEVVGIIGRNGAGKSTLKSPLAHHRTDNGPESSFTVASAAFLEVGTGFSSRIDRQRKYFFERRDSGNEAREILKKFDEIVDFAEIEKFIDTPVNFIRANVHAARFCRRRQSGAGSFDCRWKF